MRRRTAAAVATVAAVVGMLAVVDAWRQAPASTSARHATPTRPASGAPSAAATPTERPQAADGSGPVAHRSARIEDIEETAAPVPTRLRIPALGVDARVAALGVAPDGQMEVPADADTVAWYEYGPSPGLAGSAVLAAHVDYDGRRGVFFRLADLRAGDVVEVDFDDRGPRRFLVRARASVAKRALPIDELFRRGGPPTLTLITCGGEFDPVARSYRNNVVVQAVPQRTG